MRPSPLQNRVTPHGEIIAVAARGLMYGNRGGPFHDRNQRLHPTRRFASRQWLCCVLSFKGRRRTLMQPGRFTELFFLDEATALAAGHRPCFECRRADAVRFRRAWMTARELDCPPSAPEMDRVLHTERIGPDGSQRRHAISAPLPFGSFVDVAVAGGGLCAAVILGVMADGRLAVAPWTPAGYGAVEPIAVAEVIGVLTPPTIVDILRSGYRPAIHPSAGVAVTPPA